MFVPLATQDTLVPALGLFGAQLLVSLSKRFLYSCRALGAHDILVVEADLGSEDGCKHALSEHIDHYRTCKSATCLAHLVF